MADQYKPPLRKLYPCSTKPQEQRCDHAGPGGFMGHTCGEPVQVWNGTWSEGDIFRWSYTAAAMEKMRASKFFTDPYWCTSRIGVVQNNVLYDTYNAILTDGWRHTLEDANEKLALTWLGNFAGLELLTNVYEAQFYDRKDIVDISHSNSYGKKIYRRKGAEQSIERYRAVLNQKRQDAENKLSYAISILEDCARIEERLRDPNVKLQEVGL